ncbi:FapA family protein [Paenibacillus alginolyticus]|uniref:FapA family protein n=1 Tax=Paenibacillus alginolyticus TaxID=59839 RepID=A0ABT4G9X2_9BACL|nr:FapA family protein [Paenibacillus alginolyticus]MCY9692934.1 FapA family protein [Paenibacillus alginolyticus]MEC0144325.1 FapA family protein [Paenibacillus alginolyticus]
MGKSIVSKGKSVKEALDLALELLHVSRDEVDIEILETEKKGVLGLMSKPAVIRVVVKDSSVVLLSPDIAVESLEDVVENLVIEEHSNTVAFPKVAKSVRNEADLAGKVWVSNGLIFCKDAEDKYPLIAPVKNIQLYKNDVLVERTEIISELDVLRVDLQDEELAPSWELKMSPDKMEVVLVVTAGFKVITRLKDKEPSNYIHLELEEKRIPVTMDTAPVMHKLKELGVTFGVSYSDIALACSSETGGNFVIAKGLPPTQGKNGYFQPLQDTDIKKCVKERDDGTVDYREVTEFPSADYGQVLGIVIAPTAGVVGTSVTNEPVLPIEVHPVIVKPGRGVALVEDNTKVIATETGHPEVKLKGQLALISVTPKLVIVKDVTLDIGNVRYKGDVEVQGSVQDGMLVDARGNLLVRCNVNRATILAGKSILVQNNIIASSITAGKGSLLKSELAQLLDEVIRQMKNMYTAINQLSTVSAFKVGSLTVTGLGPLLRILCDGKFKSFSTLTATLVTKVNGGSDVLDNEWLSFVESLYKNFVTTRVSTLKSVEDILTFIRQAEVLYASTKISDDEKVFIKSEFVQNSELYSSGDILIAGHGVYNSKLHAKGSIVIDGFVRGGDLYAEKSVNIVEVGARGGGTDMKIAVSETGYIRVKRVLDDTTIQVGSKTQKLMFQMSNLYARLDDDGSLQIS